MTKIKEVVQYLHEIAPNHYQESYDNAGLLVGSEDTEITGVVISLDCVESVIDEAIRIGANLIVSHHPIVFRGLKRFNGSNYVERTIIKAIKHDIALFAIHTNLDNVKEHGVNTRIAQKIGLEDIDILAPKDETNLIGSGMIGELTVPMETTAFFTHLKTSMGLKVFKHTALVKSSIQRVAVCGGSGSFLLQQAIAQGADVFITSDFKYHEFFDADGNIIIADIGHYESERFTIDLLYELISNKFSNFAAHCTDVDTNPINYF